MTHSLRIVDPFGEDDSPQLAEIVRLYPAVPPEQLTVLQGPRRRPFCDCPRAVRADGSIIVWHQPSCDDVRGEDLAAIL